MTESEFEDYAAVIRSGQMPQERVPLFLAENPEFAAWYREPNPVDCSHGVAMDVFCEKCEPRSQPVSREAIARIIDPNFPFWDFAVPNSFQQKRKNRALAKADAILALSHTGARRCL